MPRTDRKGYLGHYRDFQREGYETLVEGAKQLRGKSFTSDEDLPAVVRGLGKAALGGLGYVSSPINAALRTAVGEPVEQLTGGKIPKEYSEFAASLALPIPKRIPIPGGARTAAVSEAAAPTVQELIGAYQTAKKSPVTAAVRLREGAVAEPVGAAKAEMAVEWLDENIAPRTFKILDKLTAVDEPLTMQNVDSARRLLGRIAKGDTEDAVAAGMAKRKLDDWLSSTIPAEDVLAGDAQAAQRVMQEGRANYSRAMLAKALNERTAIAELQAGGEHSGLNLQNKLRQNARQFLQSNKSRNLTEAERAEIVKFASGGEPLEKVNRWIANLLGGGGGLGSVAASTAGGLALGLPGIAAPVAGFAMNRLGVSLAARDAERLSELIRSNSPLARRMMGPIADFEKAVEQIQIGPNARNMSRLILAGRNLSNNLKDADISVSVNELLRSIQGTKPARSDEDE